MKRPTPAIATQASVQRMPRWLLLLLCAAYVLAGYIGRDAWKSDDISAFGVMKLMAQGQADWWSPQVLGMPVDTVAWLPYWLGAVCMALFPGSPELASRLPYALALALTLYFTWQSVYHLALLRAAQPVVFAFGGQARPTDYALALADSGLLALLACLGLAQLSHETSPHVFQTAAMAGLMNTAALIAHPVHRRPLVVWASWLGLAALALSGQPMLAAGVAWTQTAQHLWINRLGSRQAPGSISLATDSPPMGQTAHWLGSALLGLGLMGMALLTGPDWQPQIPESGPQWWSLAKLGTWFTWPVWPLALWTVWRWRQHLRQAHLALPLALAALALLNSLLQSDTNRLLLLSLPALSVLAALAIPTLRRSVGALIDWFSVLFFSTCATVVWVVWLAMHTGVPATPAANVARLAPDFVPQFNGWTLVVASVATLAWCLAVAWRIGRHPPYLWKSLLLPAGGSVLCWLLLMTLWLPLLDHGRSYRSLAERVAAQVGANQCVYAPDLTLPQAVGLMHYGNIDLERKVATRACHYFVTSDKASPYTLGLDGSHWLLKTRLNRLNERQESLLLFTRVAGPTPPAP